MKKITKIIILFLFLVLIFLLSSIYIKNQNDKKYDEIINGYLNNLENWYQKEVNNKKMVITNVTLGDLIDSGYAEELINPKTKEVFDRNIKFCIINDNGIHKYYYEECPKTNIYYFNTPEVVQNGYLYSQVVDIDFPDLEGLEYFIKSSKEASTNTNINYSCIDIKDNDCNEIRSTKNILADIWYKVSGDIEITYDEHNDEEGILYAFITDNNGYQDTLSITLNKIDRKAPLVILDNPINSSNAISIKIKDIVDTETGIASSLCRYGREDNNYTTISMSNKWGKLSKCSINYISKDKVYYYQVCATDLVGNVGCTNGSSLIKSVKNPIIDTNERKISFNNKKNKNLSYYIKSDVEITIDTDTIKYCGKEMLPNSCINSRIRKLIPNVWYQVEDNIIIKDISSKYANIKTLIYAEYEYVSSSTAILKKS